MKEALNKANDHKDDADRYHNQLKAKEDEIALLQEDHTKHCDALKERDLQIKKLNDEHSLHDKAIQEYTDKIKRFEADADKHRDELKEQKEKIKRLEEHLKADDQLIEQKEDRIKELEKSVDELKDEVRIKGERINHMEQQNKRKREFEAEKVMNDLENTRDLNQRLDKKILELENELTNIRKSNVSYGNKDYFQELEKQKSDNMTLKELLVEEQDRNQDLMQKASEIYVRMGESYVSAMDLIQTYQGTPVEGVRPSEACR